MTIGLTKYDKKSSEGKAGHKRDSDCSADAQQMLIPSNTIRASFNEPSFLQEHEINEENVKLRKRSG